MRFLVVLLPLLASSGALASPTCYFGKSGRLSEVVGAGHHVELFEGQLRIDGNVVNRCNGLPAEHPVAIAGWRDGFVVAFRDGGVASWDASGFHPLSGAPRVPIRSIASAGDAIFLGTVDQGLLRWEKGAAIGVASRQLDHASIAALFVDAAGTLHVGADPGGWWTVSSGGDARPRARSAVVGCFRAGSGGISALPPGPRCRDAVELGTLPSGHVAALASFADRIFIGSFDAGVFAVDDAGHVEVLEGAPRHVNALLSADDRLFIGATSGLYVARPNGVAERVLLEVPSPHVNGLAMAKGGTLWMATSYGLVGWKDGRSRLVDQRAGLPSSIVYAVAESSDGALWAGTARGAALILGDRIDFYDTDHGNLPHDWVTALLAKGDGVDVGTYNAGVSHIDARGSHPVAAFERMWINPNGLARIGTDVFAATMGGGLLTTSTRPHAPLPSDDVTAVVERQGALWIGTRAGLARVTW